MYRPHRRLCNGYTLNIHILRVAYVYKPSAYSASYIIFGSFRICNIIKCVRAVTLVYRERGSVSLYRRIISAVVIARNCAFADYFYILAYIIFVCTVICIFIKIAYIYKASVRVLLPALNSAPNKSFRRFLGICNSRCRAACICL